MDEDGPRPPISASDLVIRPLGPGDSLEDLTLFLRAAYADLAASGLRYVATYQDATTTGRRIAGAECYLAFRDGRLVGTVTYHDAASARGCPWYDRPDVANFHQLAVDPALRRMGIASRLLDLIEACAARSGASEIACDTAEQAAHLIAMYEKRGYRFVASADWRPNTNYRSVILSKAL